ncbi:MAG: hypothetical protein N3D76_00175 [Geminocystis sp.]|nr:hypothetical protein [Geminocystis sp.]HIK36719.1 hypothetical protein [Geminocystis sp. M7585_C2015_104]
MGNRITHSHYKSPSKSGQVTVHCNNPHTPRHGKKGRYHGGKRYVGNASVDFLEKSAKGGEFPLPNVSLDEKTLLEIGLLLNQSYHISQKNLLQNAT